MGEVKIISYSPQLGYPRKFKGTRGDKIHARSAGDMKTFCGLTPYIIAWQGSGVRNTDVGEHITCKNCLRVLNKKPVKTKYVNYDRQGITYGFYGHGN